MVEVLDKKTGTVKKQKSKSMALRAENDAAWKRILVDYLEDFLAFFWTEAYEAIDWSVQYELLDQEFDALKLHKKSGKRVVDKLFKVFLKTGEEQWVLIHLEVQHSFDKDFAKRMFVYDYRILDRYKQEVASLAVLADKDKSWKPEEYCRSLWGTSTIRRYKVVKVLEFSEQKEQLLLSKNPFAAVILVQLAALESGPNDEHRLMRKVDLTAHLLKSGWELSKIEGMIVFLDGLLTLSAPLEIKYVENITQMEGVEEMQYITSFERYGFKKGREEGLLAGMQLGREEGEQRGLQLGEQRGLQLGEQRGLQLGEQLGEQSFLEKLLKVKFKKLPIQYIEKIHAAKLTDIDQWGTNLLFADTLEEVFKQNN